MDEGQTDWHEGAPTCSQGGQNSSTLAMKPKSSSAQSDMRPHVIHTIQDRRNQRHRSKSKKVGTAVWKLSHNITKLRTITYTVFSMHIRNTIRIKYDRSWQKVTPDFVALPVNEKLPFFFLLGEHRSMAGQKHTLSPAASRQDREKTNHLWTWTDCTCLTDSIDLYYMLR